MKDELSAQGQQLVIAAFGLGQDDFDQAHGVNSQWPAGVEPVVPCGRDIARPEALWGKLVQGHRGRIGLTCNRPKDHEPPCRVYAADWTILAEKAN